MFSMFIMFFRTKKIEKQTCFFVFLVFENKKQFSKIVIKQAHHVFKNYSQEHFSKIGTKLILCFSKFYSKALFGTQKVLRIEKKILKKLIFSYLISS